MEVLPGPGERTGQGQRRKADTGMWCKKRAGLSRIWVGGGDEFLSKRIETSGWRRWVGSRRRGGTLVSGVWATAVCGCARSGSD